MNRGTVDHFKVKDGLIDGQSARAPFALAQGQTFESLSTSRYFPQYNPPLEKRDRTPTVAKVTLTCPDTGQDCLIGGPDAPAHLEGVAVNEDNEIVQSGGFSSYGFLPRRAGDSIVLIYDVVDPFSTSTCLRLTEFSVEIPNFSESSQRGSMRWDLEAQLETRTEAGVLH